MPRITLVAAFVACLIAPAFAQQAEIDAVNAKWIDFFNKGDFAGCLALHRGRDCVSTGFRNGEGQARD